MLLRRILGNAQVAELIRFIFLGTIVETYFFSAFFCQALSDAPLSVVRGRVIGAKMVSTVNSCETFPSFSDRDLPMAIQSSLSKYYYSKCVRIAQSLFIYSRRPSSKEN